MSGQTPATSTWSGSVRTSTLWSDMRERFVRITRDEIPICVPDDPREDLQQHRAAPGLHGEEPPLPPHPEERNHLEVRD